MSEDKGKPTSESDHIAPATAGPLVFISHDSRDADMAEAFGKLLKSVSAGMIRAFRSSDKKGNDGIDFGDEWYKRLMAKLQSTSDVVCLFTERSLERPWILFEAGVAKGKLNTPVIGVALGVPLSRVSAGPFYQFQNMDDSEPDLTKLVNQLAKRVSGLELDSDVVGVQVAAFKKTEAEILKGMPTTDAKNSPEPDDGPVAKLAEEMKALPARVAERLADSNDSPFRRRRKPRIHPMMVDEILHSSGADGDPISILMAASLVREDAPWLYELAMEVYKAAKSGDRDAIEHELVRLRRFAEVGVRSGLLEEWGWGGKENAMVILEFPRLLEHMLRRTLELKPPKPSRPPRTTRDRPELP